MNTTCTSDSANNVFILAGSNVGSNINLLFFKLDSNLNILAMKRMKEPFATFSPVNVKVTATTGVVFFYVSGRLVAGEAVRGVVFKA